MEIRRWNLEEEVQPVTALLHRAYADLAAMGLHYVATDQDDEVTRRRLAKDVSWLAVVEGAVVGTISLCPWTALSEPAEAYRRPGLWLFHQFAVDPDWQRRGIGTALLAAAESHARDAGASELGCDTAVGAEHLVALYQRLGFGIVGEADFPSTNYCSYIFVKPLG